MNKRAQVYLNKCHTCWTEINLPSLMRIFSFPFRLRSLIFFSCHKISISDKPLHKVYMCNYRKIYLKRACPSWSLYLRWFQCTKMLIWILIFLSIALWIEFLRVKWFLRNWNGFRLKEFKRGFKVSFGVIELWFFGCVIKWDNGRKNDNELDSERLNKWIYLFEKF